MGVHAMHMRSTVRADDPASDVREKLWRWATIAAERKRIQERLEEIDREERAISVALTPAVARLGELPLRAIATIDHRHYHVELEKGYQGGNARLWLSHVPSVREVDLSALLPADDPTDDEVEQIKAEVAARVVPPTAEEVCDLRAPLDAEVA
jgi:hypothetical protein